MTTPVSVLRDELLRDATQFHFVSAVRILLAATAGEEVGATGRPSEERLRFSASSRLSFASADLQSVERETHAQHGERFRITSRFLSLLGSSSVLPASFTERLCRDDDDGADARGFVDLLHHRIHALAFRVFTRSRPFEDREHPLFARAAALVGLQAGHPFAPRIGELGGLLGGYARSSSGLEQVIRAYFGGIACTIMPLLAHALALPESLRTRLGRHAHQLRGGAVLGRRRREPRRAFALQIGPMPVDRAASFLPDGGDYPALCALIEHFNRDALHCEVIVAMAGDSMPCARLDRSTRLARRTRLGGRPAPSYDARFVLTTHSEDPQ
ncbi:MAG: type VI secretion system baseplate subunit TssG [Planctomycetota bacterium]|nr:type VI secretion system baseplate subunit TssG [Planctomycetota bacterium]